LHLSVADDDDDLTAYSQSIQRSDDLVSSVAQKMMICKKIVEFAGEIATRRVRNSQKLDGACLFVPIDDNCIVCFASANVLPND